MQVVIVGQQTLADEFLKNCRIRDVPSIWLLGSDNLQYFGCRKGLRK
jgi:hypothetical protein